MNTICRALGTLLGASVLAGGGEELASRYQEGWTLRVEDAHVETFRLVSTRLLVHGEEVPTGEQLDEVEVEVEEFSSVFLDRYVAVEDGRATELQRTFVELQRTTQGIEGESEDRGVLEDRTLVLELDGDGDVIATLEGEEDVDERFLEHFELTYDVDVLLPSEEVEEGDSWSLEGEELERLLGLAQGPTYCDEEEDDDDEELDELVREASEIELTATLDAIEEYQGQRCGRIEVEISMVAEDLELDPALLGMDPTDFGVEDPESVDAIARVDLQMSVEGVVWVSLEERRPMETAFETEASMTVALVLDGGEMELSFVLEFEIELSDETRWERVDGN